MIVTLHTQFAYTYICMIMCSVQYARGIRCACGDRLDIGQVKYPYMEQIYAL